MKMEHVLSPVYPNGSWRRELSLLEMKATWRLFCFTWQPTKSNVSLVRMTVQEHDETGLPFSSSRPLWAYLVFIKAWVLQKVLWSWGMIWPGQMCMSGMSPGAHGTVPVFRTKPCGLLGHLEIKADLHVGKCNTTFSFTSFGLILFSHCRSRKDLGEAFLPKSCSYSVFRSTNHQEKKYCDWLYHWLGSFLSAELLLWVYSYTTKQISCTSK